MDNGAVSERSSSRTCAKCDTPYAITFQTVRWGGVERDLPFCLPCWRRLQTAGRVLAIAAAFGGLVLAGGGIVYARTGRLAPLAFGMLLAAAVFAAAVVYARAARPRDI